MYNNDQLTAHKLISILEVSKIYKTTNKISKAIFYIYLFIIKFKIFTLKNKLTYKRRNLNYDKLYSKYFKEYYYLYQYMSSVDIPFDKATMKDVWYSGNLKVIINYDDIVYDIDYNSKLDTIIVNTQKSGRDIDYNNKSLLKCLILLIELMLLETFTTTHKRLLNVKED